MVVQKRRASVSKVAQAALGFLTWRENEAEAKKSKNKDRDVLMKYLLPDQEDEAVNPNKVTIDSKGSRYYEFDRPIMISGKTYKAIKLQRSVTGPYADLDAYERFFGVVDDNEDAQKDWHTLSKAERERRLSLRKELYKEVTRYEWDFEAVRRLQQQGKMTKEEVQALNPVSIGWSMVPVEDK